MELLKRDRRRIIGCSRATPLLTTCSRKPTPIRRFGLCRPGRCDIILAAASENTRQSNHENEALQHCAGFVLTNFHSSNILPSSVTNNVTATPIPLSFRITPNKQHSRRLGIGLKPTPKSGLPRDFAGVFIGRSAFCCTAHLMSGEEPKSALSVLELGELYRHRSVSSAIRRFAAG